MRPLSPPRAAILAIAITVASGALVIAEASASGMGWALRASLVVTLGLGLATLVHLGLVQPLMRATAEERKARHVAEVRLAEWETLDDLVTQSQAALDATDDEAELLHILGRGVNAIFDDRESALLLCGSNGVVAWSAAVGPSGLDVPQPTDEVGRCVAVDTNSLYLSTSTARLDTCQHARLHEHERSSVCVPVGGGSTPLGAVWSVGAPGEVPCDAELMAIRRLAAATTLRMHQIRSDRTNTSENQPNEFELDGLTGLGTAGVAQRTINKLRAAEAPFAIAVCNVDQLGPYNDEHGHVAGDHALRLLAEVLCDTLRPDDVLTRFDGDTFVAVFPRCTHTQATAAMERVRESLVLALAECNAPRFTCSVGIADERHGTTSDELLEAASIALSVAKHDGGNRVRTASFDEAKTETAGPKAR